MHDASLIASVGGWVTIICQKEPNGSAATFAFFAALVGDATSVMQCLEECREGMKDTWDDGYAKDVEDKDEVTRRKNEKERY